jgi:hypothetical protein
MTWTVRPEKALEEIKENAGKFLSEKAIRVLTTTVLATPADTGRLKGNWQASVGSPRLNETGRLDKDGGPTISAETGNVSNLKDVETIYISNGVEYSEYVEAWAGMMRLGVTSNT